MTYLLSIHLNVQSNLIISCYCVASDSLGLTVASFASISSLGLIPKPSDKPDRERINQFIKILELISTKSIQSPDVKSNNRELAFSKFSNQVLSFLNNLSSRELQDQLGPLLRKASVLIRPIGSRLMDKSLKRVVKTVVKAIRRV